MPQVKVGARFESARQLDTDWRPGPGQKYADAPHVVMEVTRTERVTGPIESRVWYRPVGSTDPGWRAWSAEMYVGGPIVRRWIEEEH